MRNCKMAQATSQEAEKQIRLFEHDIHNKIECVQERLREEFDYALKLLDDNVNKTIHREIVNAESLKIHNTKSLEIGKYDGTFPISGFVKQFGFIANYSGWDPPTKSKKFISAMSGEAALVIQKHLLNEESSYKSLEDVLRNEFPDIDSITIRESMKQHSHDIGDEVFSKNVLSAALTEVEFRSHIAMVSKEDKS